MRGLGIENGGRAPAVDGSARRRGPLAWGWVFSAAVAAASFSFAVAFVSIFAGVVVLSASSPGEPDEGQILRFGSFVGTWVLPVLFTALVFALSSLLVRRASTDPLPSGISVGFLAALLTVPVHVFLYPPLDPFEVATYAFLGVAAGAMGAADGGRYLAGRDAVAEATRKVSEATVPDEIAEALGRRLASRDCQGVSVWAPKEKSASSDPAREDATPEEYVRWGAWDPNAVGARPGDPSGGAEHAMSAGPLINSPVSRRLAEERPPFVVLEPGDVGVEGGAFVVPLYKPERERVGLLVVSLGRRPLFPSRAVRPYLEVATVAALRLENFLLVKEAEETAVLRDRERLARELHDTVTQALVGVVSNLSAIPGEELAGPASARHLELASRAAKEGLDETRRAVWALAPDDVGRLPLFGALQRLARAVGENTGLEVSCQCDGEAAALPAKPRLALFRVAQEALNNVHKHARARKAWINLTYFGDAIVLDVRDDGDGFDPARRGPGDARMAEGGRSGFGLVGMRARIEELGGSFELESTLGRGTTVTAEVPVVGLGPY